MKKGEAPVEAKETIEDVARDTRRKVAFLLRKPYAEQGEVYGLAKTFFKSYLRKECEFTATELEKELHKVYLSTAVRERVEALIEKLGVLEYTDTKYSQAEVKLLLQGLDEIVRSLVMEQRKQLPPLTRFANWLFRKKVKVRATVISEYPVVERNDPVSVELNMLLEDVYAALDENRVGRAAKTYKRLLAKYHSLGRTAQQEFYQKVNAAYEAIVRQSM